MQSTQNVSYYIIQFTIDKISIKTIKSKSILLVSKYHFKISVNFLIIAVIISFLFSSREIFFAVNSIL